MQNPANHEAQSTGGTVLSNRSVPPCSMTAHLRSSPCQVSLHQAQLHTGASCVTLPEREDPVALRPLELIQDVQNAVRALDEVFRVLENSLQTELVQLTGSGVLHTRPGCHGKVKFTAWSYTLEQIDTVGLQVRC